MTTPLRLITAEPSRRTPNQMKDPRSTWTDSVGRECSLDHLRLARRLKELTGEPFSIEAAALDLLIDSDKGGELGPQSGPNGYARRWGWGDKQLRNRWNDLLTRVENWRTAYGRMGGDGGANEGRTKGEENGDSVAESIDRGEAGATEGRQEGGADVYRQGPGTNSNSNPKGDTPGGGKTGGGRKKKPARPPAGPSIPKQAAALYEAYPLKVDRRAAIAAIERRLREGISYDVLMEAVQAYDAARRDASGRVVAQFTKYPATFFNRGSWMDDRSAWILDDAGDPSSVMAHDRYLTLSEAERRDLVPCNDGARVHWIKQGKALPAGFHPGGLKP
jgi:hypothetical protein